ncbi:hypothetical protein [Cupriavidus sp. MP-37]|uniref:hypothetical protein n=1 Tax=Cupriavidus sp. MP-37 TaxID=2884455 RepID=UPI001D0B006F|nr:hypothetical protein [Cupriavidus sp. MP-37]UDM51380.1 hypothetical protein LIN44_06195 [Cupriavidus sp. MP-37]
MNEWIMDRAVRRALLKPIARRRAQRGNTMTLPRALDRIDMRSLANAHIPEIAKLAKSLQAKPDRDHIEVAQSFIALARLLFVARRITEQEYTFLASASAEAEFERRVSGGEYPELEDVQSRIRNVMLAEGLTDDEYWPDGEGSLEYLDLSSQFDVAYERRFIETLSEFGLVDLVSLRNTNREEFDRRRERGRRAIYHKDEVLAAVKDIVIRYEVDARKAASVGAYSAAIPILGAAVEGLLLIRCLRSKRKSERIALALPGKKRPKKTDDPTTWTLDALIEVCLHAGWLPPVHTQIAVIRPESLAHILRGMRNYIHPGRVVQERPWVEADEHEYKDAEAIYATLLATVSSAKSRQGLSAAAQLPLIGGEPE